MFMRSTEFSPFLYRGGFLILSIATALLVAALAHPASRLGPLIGAQPLRWIGERSYGIYLWHFPIIVLATPVGVEGPGLVRGALEVAATFAIAALSWKYIEDPIRHGALKRTIVRWRQRRRRPLVMTPRSWAALGGAGAVIAAALLGFAGVGTAPTRADAQGEVAVATTVTGNSDVADSKRTSCEEIVHIGDSTSEGLVSAEFVEKPKQLIQNQYARVGVKTAHLEVAVARSIYETADGIPNAEAVATAWADKGFDGCWVFALGTNDATNVAAGSTVGLDERIDSMMSVAKDAPVLWVNLRSHDATGYAAESNMQDWDDALLKACQKYPNMRVYDWASDAKSKWFSDDGVHFTAEGNAARARLIADALRVAFPSGADPATPPEDGCVVGSDPRESSSPSA
jgi:lysophospholipase L1-like esterase